MEVEDLRCMNLHASLAIGLEDRQFKRVGIEMEDPRCKNLRNVVTKTLEESQLRLLALKITR